MYGEWGLRQGWRIPEAFGEKLNGREAEVQGNNSKVTYERGNDLQCSSEGEKIPLKQLSFL